MMNGALRAGDLRSAVPSHGLPVPFGCRTVYTTLPSPSILILAEPPDKAASPQYQSQDSSHPKRRHRRLLTLLLDSDSSSHFPRHRVVHFGLLSGPRRPQCHRGASGHLFYAPKALASAYDGLGLAIGPRLHQDRGSGHSCQRAGPLRIA